MSVLKTAGKAIITVVPASQLARLGLPALWSLEALVVLVLIGIAWVVIDKDRAGNLALILGRRSSAEPPRPDNGDRTVPLERHSDGCNDANDLARMDGPSIRL
jgi:hypothetical protein